MSGLGAALVTATEELYRQVNPNFVHGEMLTSQVFEATKKDQGLLSVTRSSKTSAKDAFERFLARKHCRSLGVVAVTVGEVNNVGLKAHDDVLPDEAAHAVIDFNEKSDGDARRARKQLAALAQARGWRYHPAAQLN